METKVKYEDDLHEDSERIDRFLENQQSLKLIRSLVRQKISRFTIPWASCMIRNTHGLNTLAPSMLMEGDGRQGMKPKRIAVLNI